MIANHLRVAFRNIRKQRIYNILNVLGLASGMAAGLIIALHIQEEVSYEKGYANFDKIYRVHSDQWAKSCPPLAIFMKESFPDIAAIGRFAYDGDRIVSAKGSGNPGEARGFFADSSVFDVFGFHLIAGDRRQVSATPHTLVITASMARRYFGNEDPIGKMIHFDNGKDESVVGVMEDLPKNSHLQFDYLISMPTFYEQVSKEWLNHRGWMVMYTYVRFNSDQDYQKSLQLLPGFMRSFYQGWDNVEDMVKDGALRFQPLTSIHLKSHNEQEMSANSDIIYVYIFFAVELLILIVASANFMSLFTTQAIKRMKEVGMRKILGAKTGQLMGQFLTEVVVLMVMALVLSIVLYQIVLPFYNSLSGKTLGVWEVFELKNMLIIGGMLMGVVVISGLYPAFFISSFRSGSFLKENKLPNSMSSLVRNSLVIFQFVVSISLIAASILVHQQMSLLQSKDLGFDKDQVIGIRLYGELWSKATDAPDVFKSEFLKNPNVLAVGRVGSQIGDDLSVESLVPEGKEQEGNKYPSMRVLRVDEDYLTVMGIKIIAGRNFSHDRNDSSSLIINETAAKALGLDHPVDQRLTNTAMNTKGKVVGVVKDYHFASLRDKVEPLIIEWRPNWTGTMMVKIKAGSTESTVEYLRSTMEKLSPGSLFVYNFLDDHIDKLYKPEQAMAQVFEFFSILAIGIACLGLLGLSAFTIESRTKEIGIRKVLGASVSGIVQLVTSRFFVLIMTAFVISVPLTWYAMHRWLENFAYQITISGWVFVVTAVIILGVALLTVGFNTIRAAIRNPVKSLRYE